MASLFWAKVKWLMVVDIVGLSLLWLGQQTPPTLAMPTANPTVTVLSPSGGALDVIGEGDDYFTQVLNEPRDMNQYSDMQWQEFGVTNILDANGLWSATASTPSDGARVWPLYPGFSFNPTGGTDDLSAAEIGKTGWNYPVQTTKYKTLSFRVNSTTTDHWIFAYSNYSKTVMDGSISGQYNVGWDVYTATLPWGPNPAYGLMYRFGLNTPATYQVDWIRLTDPATSPVYTIVFAVNNTQAGDLVDLECYTSNQAVNANYCGRIASAIPVNSTGTYQFKWHTAYLAPGRYYVRAIVRRGATTNSDVSNGPLTIRAAPLLHIDAPSMTSGPDYATVELGNPWDMNDSSDIFTSSDLYRKPHDFATPCPCFADGELYGTVGRYDPNTLAGFGDPFVYLTVKQQHPIDTAKYKYLTYRYKIDRSPWWSSSGDRLVYDSTRSVYPAAWLVRAFFFGTFPPDLAFSNGTNDLIVFDRWNTYQMDLSKGVARGYWEPHVSETGGYWTGLKYAFRFDFLEGVDHWNVHLDYVKLTGDDMANTSYMVRWSKTEGSDPIMIDIYAGQNRSTCLSNGSQIYHWPTVVDEPLLPIGPYRIHLPVILASNPVPTNFVWNTTAVPPGTYYLCGRVSDGSNTTTMTSEAAVVISH